MRAAILRPPASELLSEATSDDDGGADVGSEDALLSSSRGPRCEVWTTSQRVVIAAPLTLAGLLVLAIVGSSLHFQQKGNGQFNPAKVSSRMTPRQLFESPQYADVVAGNMLSLANGGIHPSHRTKLKAHLQQKAQNLSALMWSFHPEEGEMMDKVMLEPHEQQAFLKMMTSVRDPRLQQLGRNLSSVMHRTLGLASDDNEVKRQVVMSLEPQLDELWKIRNEVIPESIRASASDEVPLGSLFIESDGLHFANQVHKWRVNFEVDHYSKSPELDAAMERRLFSLFGSTDSSSSAAAATGSTAGATASTAGGAAGTAGGRNVADSATDALVKYAKFNAQAEKFFNQAQEFAAKNYNLHIPNLHQALKGVNTQDLITCGMQAMMTANMQRVMKCGMQMWTIAMDVMQNIASQVGPVTTSTQQTVFKNFDSMMNS